MSMVRAASLLVVLLVSPRAFCDSQPQAGKEQLCSALQVISASEWQEWSSAKIQKIWPESLKPGSIYEGTQGTTKLYSQDLSYQPPGDVDCFCSAIFSFRLVDRSLTSGDTLDSITLRYVNSNFSETVSMITAYMKALGYTNQAEKVGEINLSLQPAREIYDSVGFKTSINQMLYAFIRTRQTPCGWVGFLRVQLG